MAASTALIVHSLDSNPHDFSDTICFDCHDDDLSDGAPMVTVWHARPDQHDPGGGMDWTLGTAHADRSRNR